MAHSRRSQGRLPGVLVRPPPRGARATARRPTGAAAASAHDSDAFSQIRRPWRGTPRGATNPTARSLLSASAAAAIIASRPPVAPHPRNGFQKLDKIKDANRCSRQLEELSDKMRDYLSKTLSELAKTRQSVLIRLLQKCCIRESS